MLTTLMKAAEGFVDDQRQRAPLGEKISVGDGYHYKLISIRECTHLVLEHDNVRVYEFDITPMKVVYMFATTIVQATKANRYAEALAKFAEANTPHLRYPPIPLKAVPLRTHIHESIIKNTSTKNYLTDGRWYLSKGTKRVEEGTGTYYIRLSYQGERLVRVLVVAQWPYDVGRLQAHLTGLTQ